MYRYKLILLLCVLFSPLFGKAQLKNNMEARVSNVAFGGFVGGIGAVINKKKSDKLGKTFIKGFYKGALGGLLIYESKNLLKKGSRNLDVNYYWPAKIINNTGASILENAVSNRGMFEQLHITIGFNRLDLYTKDKFKIRYRILPRSLVSSISFATYYNFDFKETLRTGVFIFYTRNTDLVRRIETIGATQANNVVLTRRFNTSFYRNTDRIKRYVISHEIIHVYQYTNLFAFNNYLNKSIEKLNTNKRIKWYNKYFYTEYNSISFFLIKKVANSDFLEREALFYGNY